ncbi:MAG: hypothetical protein M0P71_03125 [Melioribacteraceae bacterium]|nr:hypothetical protein [Melioribacteraceae bacterium]
MKNTLIKNIALTIILLITLISCEKKEENPLSKSEYFLNYHFDEINSDAVFSFKEKYSKDFLILLNYGFDKLKIIELLKISSIEYDDLINSLFGSGLIKKTDNGEFIPSFPIIDANEIKEIKKLSEPIGEDVSLIVIDRLQRIEEAIAMLSSYSPNSYRLRYFLFSEVLLNKWQLKNIKQNFIKSQAPQRDGKHLYISLIEGDSSSSKNPKRLLMNIEGKSDRIAFNDLEDNGVEYSSINLDDQINFSTEETSYLQIIADVIKNDLSDYLNSKRGLFLENYSKSILRETTSFKEYTYWVYQFIVIDAVNSLIKHGIITSQ